MSLDLKEAMDWERHLTIPGPTGLTVRQKISGFLHLPYTTLVASLPRYSNVPAE